MRLRFQLRWVMVLVALVAIGIGPAHRYVQTLRQRSREYAAMAQVEAIGISILTAKAAHPRFSPAEREHARTLAAWRAKRSEAYKLSARYPWTVVPDEPEPAIPAAVAAERAALPTSPAARRERAYVSGYERGIREAAEIVARVRRQQTDRVKATVQAKEAGALP